MKVAIIGGGNMGAAIAFGLATGSYVKANDISIIDLNPKTIEHIRNIKNEINASTVDNGFVESADVVMLAVKPWLIQEVLTTYKEKLQPSQLIVSIAASISLAQLQSWTTEKTPLFRLVPNTAIAIKQSMTFVTSLNATKEQQDIIMHMFDELGKTEYIKEDLIPAATSISSCGIAFAFRYIRAAMEGGVEMGLYATQSRDLVIQTLRGAIELLEANDSHPEAEIDKVTTPGGITIKGLNEMEHAGFTSAVIRGLKASHVK